MANLNMLTSDSVTPDKKIVFECYQIRGRLGQDSQTQSKTDDQMEIINQTNKIMNICWADCRF